MQLHSFLTSASVFTQTWWALIKRISFYPAVLCLIGGIILNMHQGSTMVLELTLFFLWMIISAPLWFLGQHWIAVVPILSATNTLLPFSSSLVGYHMIIVSLFLLVLLLIWHMPQLVFAFHFLAKGSRTPIQDSIQFTQGHYKSLFLKILLLSIFSIIFQSLFTLLVTSIPGLFLQLYTPSYIALTNTLRSLSLIFGTAITTSLWIAYFHRVFLQIKKELLNR